MPDVSVIIPVHDAAKTLAGQLDALANQADAPDFEVVIVLNCCSDASSDIASSFVGLLDVVVVEANDRASAAYARNSGVARASGSKLLFCDSDDRVGERWVTEMVSALSERNVDFAGGRIVVDRAGLPDWIYRRRYAQCDGACLMWRDGLPFAMAASLACGRQALDSVGGFDERFDAAGYEEVDLARSLLREGCRIGEAPDATVSYRPRTTVRAFVRQSRSYARGAALLYEKEGRLGPRPTRARLIARPLRRAVTLACKRRGAGAIAYECLMYYIELAERRRLHDAGTCGVAPPAVRDFAVRPSAALVGGLAMRARAAQAKWYLDEGFEGSSLALVDALLPVGGVFVDVGANIGVFTVAAALRTRGAGRVISFEPDPRTRALLAENVARHSSESVVEISARAVAATTTRRPFHLYENDIVSGFGAAPAEFLPGRIVETVTVDVTSLDDAVLGRVDMLKVDVEGFEADVLRGASGVLRDNPDLTLIVEVNPAALEANGSGMETLLHQLPAAAWAWWLVDDSATSAAEAIHACDDWRDIARRLPRRGWANLLAVRRERRTSVQARIEEVATGSVRTFD